MSRAALKSALIMTALTVAGTVAHAQSATARASNDGLQSIAWMTGGTWTAEAKAPDGKVTKVESQIRWAANKQAINFITSFNGEPQYSGMYCWDPARKTVAFFYTSSEGEFTSGTAKFRDGVLSQEFTLTHADGKADNLRSVIKRDGENAYDWSVQANRNGTWTTLIALRYTRRSAAGMEGGPQ